MTKEIVKYLCCISLLFSCKEIISQKSLNCISYSKQIKNSPQYEIDSSLISFTVYRWIDSSYSWYEHYNCTYSKNCRNTIYVGDIFYSLDKLKLTAFIYVEYNKVYTDSTGSKKSKKENIFFDSHTVMGYRDSLNQSWKLFALNEIFLGLRGNSLRNAENYHRNIFFSKEEMNKRKIGVYDTLTGLNTKYESIKYLPCEDGFWTKSPLWKKGNRVPNYYSFETFMNSTPLNKTIRPYFKINHPQ